MIAESGMIGVSERECVWGGFRADIRSDGRACDDSRPLRLSVGDLQQCSGSARCTMGSTDVIAGVKVGGYPNVIHHGLDVPRLNADVNITE